MIKKLLALFLTIFMLFSICSCAESGEELARDNFDVNSDKVMADGLAELYDRLEGVYEDQDDLIELGGQNTIPLVEFDDAVYLSIGEFDFYTRYLYYIMVEIKSSAISNALLYGINAKNDDAFWNSLEIDTYKTKREVALEKSKTAARYAAISNAIMKDYGFVESDSYQLSYENLLVMYGNKQAINDHYCAYGLGDDYILPYLKQYSAYSEFREFMVGVDGELYPTDEQAKEFFRDKCIYMEQIVFNYTYTDENGYCYKKSDAEIADARRRGEEVYASIKEDPRMFDRNMHLTEHPEWSENAYGYTYIPNDIIPELEDAYFKLKPGEIVAVDTPLGYYILRALEKTDKAYEDSNSRIIDGYREMAFAELMNQHMDKLNIINDEFNRYDFKDILVFTNN